MDNTQVSNAQAQHGANGAGVVQEGTPAPSLSLVPNQTAVGSSPDSSVAAPPPAPRVKRKERWVPIEDDDYEGFQFRIWVNYPQELDSKIKTTATEEEIGEALNKIVLEHNGWCDTEGKPYPPAGTLEFWKAIPNELVAAMIMLIRLESTKLPNSLAEKRRNTRNT